MIASFSRLLIPASHRLFLTSLLVLLLLGILPATAESGGESHVSDLFSHMTSEERVGQLFMPAISASGTNGTTGMTGELKELLDTIHPGGVILFSRDIVSPAQLVTLTTDLEANGSLPGDGEPVPLFIAIDQEGGYLTRLPFGPRMPGNMALGAAGSADLTRTVAKMTGEELRSLGITMNFAPVLDVETNQNNPVIGIRSFGSDPGQVADLGTAYIEGMHDAGIICCGKHFPGHGDVDQDSHFALPLEAHNHTRMNEVELVPFKAAIAGGVDAIMTAHIIFPAYDNTTILLPDGESMQTPATLSKPILTGLLRDELGFDGLIITDAMMMKAISDTIGTNDAAVRAVRAGADIILYPDPVEEAYDAVLAAYQEDPEIRERVNESVIRILRVKEQYHLKDLYPNESAYDLAGRIRTAETIALGKDAFRIEADAADRTVTLLKDDDRIIPVPLHDGDTIGIFAPTDSFAAEMNQAVQAVAGRTGVTVNTGVFNYSGRMNLSGDETGFLPDADLILLGTISTNATMRTGDYYIPNFAADLIDRAGKQETPLIGFALNQPYDIMYMQDIPVYFATYAGKAGGPNLNAALSAVFGEIPITGRLPVTIEDLNGTILYPAGSGIMVPC